MVEADIAKLHIADLSGRYSYQGCGLDIVELAAIYGKLSSHTQQLCEEARSDAATMRCNFSSSLFLLLLTVVIRVLAFAQLILIHYQLSSLKVSTMTPRKQNGAPGWRTA